MSTAPSTPPPTIVIFSGGSAANSLVDVFGSAAREQNCHLSYVIPISDNGGSSSELIRVFGGPGIGDLRSRLVRLIPSSSHSADKTAIRRLFNYRLPADSATARQEWLDVVEARHALWEGVATAKKELIRSIINVTNYEIVKKTRPSSVFNFSEASIGNMFLTGARLFTGSLESAIYLLSIICHVPPHTSVLPAINTNFTHHIAAGLANGSSIVGQNAISHPSEPTALPDALDTTMTTSTAGTTQSTVTTAYDDLYHHDAIEDANLPGSLPSLRKPNISFDKSAEEPLPGRIERIWYINPYGQEIRLTANPAVLEALKGARAVVYSVGSLYTSIVPSLILRGVGEAIASPTIKYKILILNSSCDRETGSVDGPFTAVDFVAAVAKAAAESRGLKDVPGLEYRHYVTHLFYLQGEGVPEVNKSELAALGIEVVKLYGRPKGKALRYDENALLQTLNYTIGKEPRKERSRRNTMEG